MNARGIQKFVITYNDIPISVLDKYRTEQQTISKISLEIQSISTPNIDLVGTLIYRPETSLTINEIPLLLLQIRENIDCDTLIFSVHFPYIIRQSNNRILKCDCTFQFKDLLQGCEFHLTMHWKMHRIKIKEEYQDLELQLIIESQDFVWIEDLYQIFENICKDSFANIDAFASKVISFFEFVPKNQIPLQKQNIQYQSLDLSITSHIDLQKSYTVNRFLQNHSYKKKIPSLNKKTTETETFGSWLKKQRRIRNIKQQDLSKTLHVSNSFVSKVESGEKLPSKDFVEKISTLWNISPDFLYVKAQIFDSHAQIISQNPSRFLKWIYEMRRTNLKIQS